MMRGKLIFSLLLCCLMMGLNGYPLMAEESAQSDDKSSESKMISLVEVAPELYHQFRRYPKFYGDPNTNTGEFAERTQLLGSAGGGRDFLVDHGIYFDVSVTQFYQGVVSGGNDDNDARYNGTVDYFLNLDTGKAGFWPGGVVFLHAESSWRADESVNLDTGSLLPANYDAAMPTPGENEGLALPELYLVQALPANFLLVAGKVNWAGLADNNLFANNERTQFVYTGLNNNPILGNFIPYTSIGLGGIYASPDKKHTVALLGIQRNGDATSSGFGKFNSEYSVGFQYQYTTLIGGKLGNYRLIAGRTNQDQTDFSVDPRQLIGEIIGSVPVKKKSENYTFLINFDQYLWIKEGASAEGRKGLPPVGIGIFGRAGWAPDDRNVISQFYSFGIGGYGMLIPGRDNDQWGIGWGGTYISSDVRDIVEFTGIDLDSFEHAIEVFYNLQVTPAVHLSVDAQMIDSPVEAIDTAYTLATRLQVDF